MHKHQDQHKATEEEENRESVSKGSPPSARNQQPREPHGERRGLYCMYNYSPSRRQLLMKEDRAALRLTPFQYRVPTRLSLVPIPVKLIARSLRRLKGERLWRTQVTFVICNADYYTSAPRYINDWRLLNGNIALVLPSRTDRQFSSVTRPLAIVQTIRGLEDDSTTCT